MPEKFMDSDTKIIKEHFSDTVSKIEPLSPYEDSVGRLYLVCLEGRDRPIGLAVRDGDVIIMPT